MIESRYVSTLIGSLAMVTAGSFTTFALFGDEFVIRFGLSFQQINLVSAINLCAQYSSYLVIGPMFDRYGIVMTQILCTATLAVGYFLIYLSFALVIPTNTALLSLYYFLGGFGSRGIYMVVCGAVAHNFEAENLGFMMGIVLLFYGISGLVYSLILTYACDGNLELLLLVLAISSFVINGCAIFAIRKEPLKPLISKTRSDAVIELLRPDNYLHPAEPHKEEGEREPQNSSEAQEKNEVSIPDVNDLAQPASANELCISSEVPLPKPEPTKSLDQLPPMSLSKPTKMKDDMTPRQIMRSRIFWYCAILRILQQGSTYMVNVNAIIRASYGPSVSSETMAWTTANHITIMSACQSVGRFTFAAGSDIFAKYNIDRTALLVLAELLLFLGAMIMATIDDFSMLTSTPTLLICSFLIGSGWGGEGGLLPPLIKQLFGLKFYGTANAFVMSGVPIGIFAFNYLFGALYDDQLQTQISEGGPTDFCYGGKCFKIAFICTSAVQSIVLTLSILLYLKAAKTNLFNRRASA